eukprot:6603513-Pyramimonas_sp.AAC.1
MYATDATVPGMVIHWIQNNRVRISAESAGATKCPGVDTTYANPHATTILVPTNQVWGGCGTR